MQCPFCGQDDDKVVDSRASEGGKVIRRRRECLACSRRYTTYERLEETIRLAVIKKDGSREPYDRQKLIGGLQMACYKRPITETQIRHIVEAAEEAIFQAYDRDVPSSFIGDQISDGLRTVDKIAYIRFASVYRNFTDVGELIDEAQEVRDLPAQSTKQNPLFEPDK